MIISKDINLFRGVNMLNSWIIPKEIVSLNYISGNSKLLYAVIYSFCSSNSDAFMTNKYFANLIGVSSRQVNRYLEELKNNNLINIIYKKNKRFINITSCNKDTCINNDCNLSERDKHLLNIALDL